ncbi:MAG: hypothetical protein NTW21_39425 [Verrucomicrobia bacterium]|nr:hypothetical protein [Verrucomicrobiota bacterium]
MDLIRLLLMQQETGEDPPELRHYEVRLVLYNIALMLDAGLIDGHVISDHIGEPAAATMIRMTWVGLPTTTPIAAR